jgi:hypothetical protein
VKKIPADAHLDNRWNACLDLNASAPVPVSDAELARAWEAFGPDQVLIMLWALAVVADEAAGGVA